jgi:hypothetical protein
MMPILNAGQLTKASLTFGALLIFIAGMCGLPEVGTRVFPERYWRERLRDTQYHLMKATMQQDKLEATQMALARGKDCGFPTIIPGSSGPTAAGIRQCTERFQVTRRRHQEIKAELEEMAERYRRLMDAAGGESLALAPGMADPSLPVTFRE